MAEDERILQEYAMTREQKAEHLRWLHEAMQQAQWEHKQPTQVHVPFGGLRLREHPVGLGVTSGTASAQPRSFTREEVLTVIRTLKASWQVHGSEDYDNGAKRAFADMAATVANME